MKRIKQKLQKQKNELLCENAQSEKHITQEILRQIRNYRTDKTKEGAEERAKGSVRQQTNEATVEPEAASKLQTLQSKHNSV